MLRREGYSAAWNYTIGPALVYEGRASLDAIHRAGDPVVVVAEALPLKELLRIDVRHVRGFALDRGDDDPTLTTFLASERRAAVLGLEGIAAAVRTGDVVIVDGVNGLVYVDPDPETVARYAALRRVRAPPVDREGLLRLGRQAARRMMARGDAEAAAATAREDAAGAAAGHGHAPAHAHAEPPPKPSFEIVKNTVLGRVLPIAGRALDQGEELTALEGFLEEMKRLNDEKAAAEAAAKEEAPAGNRRGLRVVR